MNVLSLFDGMSCGQIALKRLGIKIDNYYASEVDQFAIQVAKQNNQEMNHIGDVRNVNLNNLEPIDLLIGGSPCQSFSFAGKRNGMTTKESLEILTLEQYLELKEQNTQFEGQSYLFWEYVRILKEIQQYNPNVKFLLENVVMIKKWEEIISNTLGVKPIKINSSLVSAQNRPRIYWTNIDIIDELEDKNIKLSDILLENHNKELITLNNIMYKSKNYYFYFYNDVKKRASSQGYRIYYGDKAPCLSVGGANSTKIFVEFNDNGKIVYRKITPLECERLQTVPENYTNCVSDSQRFKMLGNGWTIDIICYLLKGIKNV